MNDMVTFKVNLIGKVQGVGMRFYINRTSKKYKINGYVRNLYNGQVECVLQTDRVNLDDFLIHVKKYSPGHIDEVIKEEIFDSKIYKKFQVKLI